MAKLLARSWPVIIGIIEYSSIDNFNNYYLMFYV